MDARVLERLKWRSRRGLLELDLVLTRFWAGEGREMTATQASAMEKLLMLPDNDLLDVVMGRKDIPEDALRELVGKLQAA